MGGRAAIASGAFACALALLCSSPSAAIARDVVVTSFDGTPIVAHYYSAEGLSAGDRAPTVLAGPGYGSAGNTSPSADSSDAVGTATWRREGYNVLTWDPRGLGRSGGIVMFDSPAFEGRDVQALIDFVAVQPEALLDASGDPRVGMSGFSYGAGIQFVSAAIDSRIDAIAPQAGWHSLLTSFVKDGALKGGWLTELCAGGELASLTGGLLFGPAGLQIGGTAAELKRLCLESIVGGSVSAASRQWLADRGPNGLLQRIKAPTLIVQGTADALFPPSEAIENYAALRDSGVPVKMIWYCGGHGGCPTPVHDWRRVPNATLAWFDRWLKRDVTLDTGAPFEWVADDGVWRSGPDYPLASAGALQTSGAGLLVVSPVDSVNSGLLRFATPAINAVNIRFASPPEGSDIVGEPQVRLAYRGVAVPARTFLYAQVLSAANQRVIGPQVTPIHVVLDGRPHTIERPLEPIAVRGATGSDYRLQLTPGTTVYAPQRSIGSVRLDRVEASLPLVDAGRAARATGSSSALVTRQRLHISVSSSRSGRFARVAVRGRLSSPPCSGALSFTIRARSRVYTRRTGVASTCVARAVIRLRVPRRTRVHVSARVQGNSAVTARRVTVRVR